MRNASEPPFIKSRRPKFYIYFNLKFYFFEIHLFHKTLLSWTTSYLFLIEGNSQWTQRFVNFTIGIHVNKETEILVFVLTDKDFHAGVSLDSLEPKNYHTVNPVLLLRTTDKPHVVLSIQ